MGAVEWSRISGELCEQIVAVCLLREHPEAQRVKPSQGDGGIDIYVPLPTGQWDVYQVKGFTGRLDANRKRQIRKSWLALAKFLGENPEVRVNRWRVVRPENATLQDRRFLSSVTGTTPIDCAYSGLDFCDSLAARHPEVIDYYLHDGRDRVEELVATYLRAASVQQATPTTIRDSVEPLRAVSDALNASDPHYYYDFEVLRRPPSVADDDLSWPDIAQDVEGLAYATARIELRAAIVYRVFRRYNGADEDRPLFAKFVIETEPGSPEREQLQAFLDYGEQTGLLPAASIVTEQGTNGDEQQASEGFVRFGPPAGRGAVRLKARILDADGVIVAALDFAGKRGSAGQRGGGSLTVSDATQLVQLRVRLLPDQMPTLNLTVNPPFNCSVVDAVQVLRFVRALRSPHRLEVAQPWGPVLTASALTDDFMPDVYGSPMFLDDLDVVQSISAQELAVPEPEVIDEQKESWRWAATLITSRTLTRTWGRRTFRLELHDGVEDPMQAGEFTTLEWTEPTSILVGQQVVDLGVVASKLSPAVVVSVTGRGRHRELTVDPLDNTVPTETQRLLTATEAEQLLHDPIPAEGDTVTDRMGRPIVAHDDGQRVTYSHGECSVRHRLQDAAVRCRH